MSQVRTAGLFTLLAVIWGLSFVAIKAGLPYIPPVLFAAVRYDIAGVLMLGYAFVRTENWRPDTRADWMAVGAGAVFLIAVYNALLFIGEQGVTSGVAAILVATSPLLTTAISRLLLPSEKLGLRGSGGLLVGFVGVGLVTLPALSALNVSNLRAPTLVLLAAACMACGSVLIQREESRISAQGLVGWSNALGALLLHGIVFVSPGNSVSNATWTIEAVLAVGYLAIVASAVGYTIYFTLLNQLGAIEINFITYAQPVVAVIAGWILLGETLGFLSVIGFLLIFGGFVLLKWDTLHEELPNNWRAEIRG